MLWYIHCSIPVTKTSTSQTYLNTEHLSELPPGNNVGNSALIDSGKINRWHLAEHVYKLKVKMTDNVIQKKGFSTEKYNTYISRKPTLFEYQNKTTKKKSKKMDMEERIPDQQWKGVLLLLIYYVRLYLDVLLLMRNMACSLITCRKGRFLRVHFLVEKKKKRWERRIMCLNNSYSLAFLQDPFSPLLFVFLL